LGAGRDVKRVKIKVSGEMNLRTIAGYLRNFLCAASMMALAACLPREAPSEISENLPPEPVGTTAAGLHLLRSEYSDLAQWNESDTSGSFVAFTRSCAAIADMAADAPMGGAGYGGAANDWRAACSAAENISPVDSAATRNFFESKFVPFLIFEGENQQGLFTGYFEPELRGSLTRQGAYQTPLYGLPSDLVSVDLGLFRENLSGQRVAGRISQGRLVPYDTRAEITRNGLDQAEELLFIDDPVDAFFLSIQGSGRVRLTDGSVVRAAYAGQNGHPYTAIGAALIRQGEMTREEVSMQSIRAWLDTHPERAQTLLEENDSYIFFSLEPLADPTLGARAPKAYP
jgi:membrane-bound lytic murein transglycosylase A